MSCLCPFAPARHESTCVHATEQLQHQLKQEATPPPTFRSSLQYLLNRFSMEAGSNSPDFVLAQFLQDSLRSFDRAVVARDLWYGGKQRPPEGEVVP